MKLTDGIYAYPWTNYMENNCNTYVLQGDALVLVDPGLKKYVPDIVDAMKKDGLDPEQITHVINTHGHPDHMDGDAYFMDSDVKMSLHEEEERFLNDIGKQFFSMFGLESPRYRVDFFAAEGSLKAAGIDLEIIHTPGHSPGSICLYWADKQALVSGDVVFSGSIGRTDFPGGSGSVLKQSIEKIAGYDIKLLLPGHNEVIEGADAVKQNFDFIKRSFFSFM